MGIQGTRADSKRCGLLTIQSRSYTAGWQSSGRAMAEDSGDPLRKGSFGPVDMDWVDAHTVVVVVLVVVVLVVVEVVVSQEWQWKDIAEES